MSDFEQQAIGTLLLKPSLISEMDCQIDNFQVPIFREIYRAILSMTSRGVAIDVITVADELKKQTGHDWLADVATIARESFVCSNLAAYNQEIKNNYQRKQAICIAEKLITQLKALDDTAIDTCISELMALNHVERKTEYNEKQKAKLVVEYIERVFSGAGDIAITTGLRLLDKNLGGFHDTDLIVFGARPSMGKTALLVNMMLKSGVASGLISTEQNTLQLGLREVCTLGNISGAKLRSGDLQESDWPAINSAISQMSELEIYTNDQSTPLITDVQRQARRWHQQHKIKALYVDYIQRIEATDSRAPKHERVEEVVKGLKSIAKELEIPVIALAQVNRSVDTRGDKRPGMGDLSDSSAIEKEADQIIMLYRDEVYNEDTQSKGIAELIIEKNRHGPTNFVRVGYHGPTFRFHDLENYQP